MRPANLVGAAMRRLFILLSLLAFAAPAQAKELRFPHAGQYAFRLELPPGWTSNVDKRGGLLLVPPEGHAMIYLAIVTDDKLRGREDSAVVRAVSAVAGVVMADKQDPERITTTDGTRIIRGTAFYGTMPGKHGLTRRARIVVFNLAPATWAQMWTVTQAGMNAIETAALAKVLDGLSLTSR